MIALEASAAGNTTVKSPAVDVLSAPKSNTATAGSPVAVSLNIKPPLTADMVTLLKTSSAKSTNAVVPLDVGVTGAAWRCGFAV